MDTSRDRVTVQEAAARLGVTEQAVRKRVKRGTLGSDKEPDGRVYVYLDAGRDEDRDGVPNPESGALISQMQQRIDDLREALEAEREANRENRRIIAGLTQRIPAIEPRDDHQEPQEQPGRPTETSTTPEAAEDRRGPDKPRWWRFWE